MGCVMAGEQRLAQNALARPLFVGLDLSTICTGATVLDYRGRVLACDVVRPRASLSLLDKSRKICAQLRHVRELCEGGGERRTEWFVAMEDSAKRWANGKGGAVGLMTLAMLNSIVSYECSTIFGSSATVVHPAVARTFFGVQSRQSGKAKDFVLDFILWWVPSFPLHAFAKLGKAWICATNFDQSDSYLLAMQSMAHYLTATVLNNDVLQTVLRTEMRNILRDHSSGDCPALGPVIGRGDSIREAIDTTLSSFVREQVSPAYPHAVG